MILWKRSNNTSWNIRVAFLESCISISEANECLTGENIKKPYNKCFINLVCSVRTKTLGKYFPI